MSSQQSTYPQQHEPWRPDYPPVWHGFVCDNDEGLRIIDIKQPWGNHLYTRNIQAFSVSTTAIDKAMNQ